MTPQPPNLLQARPGPHDAHQACSVIACFFLRKCSWVVSDSRLLGGFNADGDSWKAIGAAGYRSTVDVMRAGEVFGSIGNPIPVSGLRHTGSVALCVGILAPWVPEQAQFPSPKSPDVRSGSPQCRMTAR